jgi:hypothetical protein
MNKSALSMLVFFCVFVSIGLGQKVTDFSGSWTLDKEKTELSRVGLYLSKIEVTQKGDTLIAKRTYVNRDGEHYPFTEHLTLDGQEAKMEIYDMPRTSSAKLSEDKTCVNVVSTVTYYGDYGATDIQITERWSLEEGNVLKIHSTSKTDEGERELAAFYKKL